MSAFLTLLNDSCTIQTRTVTAGKTQTESWANSSTVKCRVLKQAISSKNLEKTQYATVIRTRFALPPTAVVSIRDRISHGGRVYDVIEVTTTLEGSGKTFHKVAVCEGIAGNV